MFPGGIFLLSPAIFSLKAVHCGPGRSDRRIKSHRKASVAVALLAGLCLTLAAHAQTNAIWDPPAAIAGQIGDYNDPGNWSPPPSTPGPTGTATFSVFALSKEVTFSQPATSVGSLVFGPASACIFEVPHEVRLNITGSGISSTPTNAPIFNVSSVGNPALVFESGTAGSATFNVTNTADMEFRGMSTAGNATINARPGQTSIRATVGPRITQLNFHLRAVPVQKRTQTPHSRCG